MTNNQAVGFAILAMHDADISKDKIKEIIGLMNWHVDIWTEEEAENGADRFLEAGV